ncbi:unnamed protein product [Symbiodinium sp. CCMP2592]|nr:unnamed protein product [Symbiodinium sp. CCMP2592]CAE7831567.1 unnamed protein product [Symbiodinium sp. CCMP2592]
MPSHPLSAVQLLRNGAHPAGVGGLESSSRAERALRVLATVKYRDPQSADCAANCCAALGVLLRHLDLPRGICVLDILLVAYLVLRSADERAELATLEGGRLSLAVLRSIWCAENPFYILNTPSDGSAFLSFKDVLPALNLHTVVKRGNVFRDDPLNFSFTSYWSNSRLSTEALLLNVLFSLATRSKVMIQHLLLKPDLSLASNAAVMVHGCLWYGFCLRNYCGDGSQVLVVRFLSWQMPR